MMRVHDVRLHSKGVFVGKSREFPPRFPGHVYSQNIPIPDDIQPGSPAPWAEQGIDLDKPVSIQKVLNRLNEVAQTFEAKDLPGDPDEMFAVADARRQPITKRSAVLVGLFEQEGDTHVILTRRSWNLSSHKGEVSFPGGRSDESETPVETALRETFEEVGITPDAVHPVAWLQPIVTFASGSAIWPVVATLAEPPTMVTDPNEVEHAFTISLRDLLAPGSFVEERWRRDPVRPGADGDGYFPIYFYKAPHDVIWGATARILTELLCIVTDTPWPERSRVWA